MTTATALAQIDHDAQGLARLALAGELTQGEARAGLVKLLMDSQVSASVAWTKTGLHRQTRHDLAENVLATLVDRVLDEGSTFDLTRIADGSLCGWARMLGMKVSVWDKAVRRTGVDAITWQVSPLAPARNAEEGDFSAHDSDAATYHAAQAFGGLSAEDIVLSDWADSERLSNALERASNLTSFAREPVQDKVCARVLRETFRLPALCVPDDTAERASILAAVRADGTLAGRALVQMAAMVCSEPPHLPAPGEAPVGELLLSMWDNFDPEHLESLMVRPAKAAHVIVLDAVTLRPKPSRGAVRALTRAVRASSMVKDWVLTQDTLVASFLATCTEAVSQFDDTSDAGAKALKQASAAEAAARWPGLAARVAAFPGAPLGSTPGRVGERLRELLDDAQAKDTDDRIATRVRRGLGEQVADAA